MTSKEKFEKEQAIFKEIEEQKQEEIVLQKKKEEARTLPVMFRGTKKTAVIKKSEYDSVLHICI